MNNNLSVHSDDIIVIGRVGAPYGVRGWLKVNSFTHPHDSILDYKSWLIKLDQCWEDIDIIDGKPHGQDVVVQFPECHDRETAKRYTHAEIAVYRKQLPDVNKGEFYWHDLEGLTVVDLNNRTLGTVAYLIGAGASDVLIVEDKGKQLGIPFLYNEVVLDVNLEERCIRVDWDPDY